MTRDHARQRQPWKGKQQTDGPTVPPPHGLLPPAGPEPLRTPASLQMGVRGNLGRCLPPSCFGKSRRAGSSKFNPAAPKVGPRLTGQEDWGLPLGGSRDGVPAGFS